MSTTIDKDRSARNLFLQQSFGVLATISLDLPGYPFGSVTPYCADEQGRPVIYISRIAQHTKNIIADRRVSLTVLENGLSDDVQAQGRLTCIADAVPVGSDNEAAASQRYFRYFPSARQYEQTHDFVFFRLEAVRIRFIGGFGRIYWLEPEEFLVPNPFSPAQESQILNHMNSDHQDALRRYCGGEPAEMVGIDGEGFDVLASSRKRRFTFETPIHTMEDARRALVAMARQ
jgi:putative heme iron utilization protein